MSSEFEATLKCPVVREGTSIPSPRSQRVTGGNHHAVTPNHESAAGRGRNFARVDREQCHAQPDHGSSCKSWGKLLLSAIPSTTPNKHYSSIINLLILHRYHYMIRKHGADVRKGLTAGATTGPFTRPVQERDLRD